MLRAVDDVPSRTRELEGALMPRREVVAVALVLASMVVPFGIGALLGPLPHDVPLEPRLAWVLASATAIVLGAWVVQREGAGAWRFVPAAALFLPLLHLVRPSSSVVAALDAAIFVLAGLGVATRVSWGVVARRRGRPRQWAPMLALLLAANHAPLVLVAFGLVSCVVVPSAVRLAHPTPTLEGTERAADVSTQDGLTLRATYWPGLPGAPAVVLAHGRGDGRDRMLGWARELNACGAHVLAYDGRAHAASDGAVVTFADREPGDVVSAAEALQTLSGAPTSALAVMGVSMGGGAVLGALPELDRRGVRRAVLLSPASDYEALVGAFMPPPPLRAPSRFVVVRVSNAMGFSAPFDQIPRDALQDAPHVAVLVIHPRLDRTIPLSMSERLVADHPRVTLRIVERGGHNGFENAVLADPPEHEAILAALGVRTH